MNLPYDSYLMCIAGKNLPCKSIQTGQFRNDLVSILHPHILDMINRNTIGHWGFQERVDKIRSIIPNACPMEVVAMNMANNPTSAAKELFDQWRNSPPHWQAINHICRYYCYSLGISNNKNYGIGIIIA